MYSIEVFTLDIFELLMIKLCEISSWIKFKNLGRKSKWTIKMCTIYYKYIKDLESVCIMWCYTDNSFIMREMKVRNLTDDILFDFKRTTSANYTLLSASWDVCYYDEAQVNGESAQKGSKNALPIRGSWLKSLSDEAENPGAVNVKVGGAAAVLGICGYAS